MNGRGARRGGNGGNGWGGPIGERHGAWEVGIEAALGRTEQSHEGGILEDVLRARPMVTLAVAFGIGLLLGLGSRD